jgi:alcohol dehydrogenase
VIDRATMRPVSEVATTALPAGAWQVQLGSARVLYGEGTVDLLGEVARDLRGSRALLVTDPGVRSAGHVARAEASLAAAGIRVSVFDGVEENPAERHVDAGVVAALEFGIDFLIGLGGGSAMDTAKGINFLLTNGGRMEDYWGSNRARRPMLPSIGIPTTAGTGSEMQSYALIAREGDHRKMACGDEKVRFRAVILDPGLTASCPRSVAAVSGLDAVSHAVESYVTTLRNPLSQMYARQAWTFLEGSLEAALETPADAAARGRVLLGAFLSGNAIESSMLGAAHACANPLTSRHEVPHGIAVLLLLPHVVRFNETVVGGLYEDLRAQITAGTRESLAARIEELREEAGLPTTIREFGVPRRELADLATEANDQWTARFNPRPVTATDLERLYESAY